MQRPWSKRAEELRPEHGDGCDVEAWCEWLRGRMIEDDRSGGGISHSQYANMLLAHSTGEVALYAAFCDAIDFTTGAER